MKSYTLMELLNRTSRSGDAASVAEVLIRDNPMLQDAAWEEANDIFGYTFTQRLTLPKGSFRDINQGVPVESAKTQKVTERLSMLESYSEVDQALVDNHPDRHGFRMLEAAAHIEGMSQTLANAIFYGYHDEDPRIFTGLAPRLSSLSQGNVYNCGGTANLTSAYIVQWGNDKVSFFHPKGHATKGIEHVDLGVVTAEDASGNKFQAYRDHFKVHCGLAVKDNRSIIRVANINSKANKGGAGFLNEDLLIAAINDLPMNGAGAVIYVPKSVRTQMEILLKDKGNINFSVDGGEGLAGERIVRFRGIPVKKVDAISDNEKAVI